MSRPLNQTTANRIIAYCEMVHSHIAHDFLSGAFRVYAAEVHRLWPEESLRYLQRLFKDLGLKGYTTLEKAVSAVASYFKFTPDPASEKKSWITRALVKWREFRHSQRCQRIGIGSAFARTSEELKMLKRQYVENRDHESQEERKKAQAELAHKRIYGNLTKEEWCKRNQQALEEERQHRAAQAHRIRQLEAQKGPVVLDTEAGDRMRAPWAKLRQQLQEQKERDLKERDEILAKRAENKRAEGLADAERYRERWARVRAAFAAEQAARDG